MNDNVVTLPGVTLQVTENDPVPEVVALLEEMLGRAKRGEVTWVGLAYLDQRDVGFASWGPRFDEGIVGHRLTSALGAVSWLDKRLCHDVLMGSRSIIIGATEGEEDEDGDDESED